jgi:FeS assembly SUF system protein
MALDKLLNMFRDKPSENDTPQDEPARNGADLLARAAATTTASELVPLQEAPPAESAPVAEPKALPDLDEMREMIIRMIRTVFDPEIPVNIYDLGLIYEVHLNDERDVLVQMTLTAPNCPSAGELPVEVEQKIRAVHGVKNVQVELVWEPPWNKDMMSEVARMELGI